MPYKDWEGFSKQIKAQQAKRGYPKFPGLKHLKHKFRAKKATTRLKIGTPRAKWLQELKQEEDITILFRFKERHIKGYYKAASQRYYRKDKPITLTTVYQEWYKQRINNNWESFNK